jgi:hypothetical protein
VDEPIVGRVVHFHQEHKLPFSPATLKLRPAIVLTSPYNEFGCWVIDIWVLDPSGGFYATAAEGDTHGCWSKIPKSEDW